MEIAVPLDCQDWPKSVSWYDCFCMNLNFCFEFCCSNVLMMTLSTRARYWWMQRFHTVFATFSMWKYYWIILLFSNWKRLLSDQNNHNRYAFLLSQIYNNYKMIFVSLEVVLLQCFFFWYSIVPILLTHFNCRDRQPN